MGTNGLRKSVIVAIVIFAVIPQFTSAFFWLTPMNWGYDDVMSNQNDLENLQNDG